MPFFQSLQMLLRKQSVGSPAKGVNLTVAIGKVKISEKMQIRRFVFAPKVTPGRQKHYIKGIDGFDIEIIFLYFTLFEHCHIEKLKL